MNARADPLGKLLERTMVVVPHPDDEAVASGTLMQRMREVMVVIATDGAPLDDYFWKAHGSREKYAELRRREALAAAGEIGVQHLEFLRSAAGDPFIDQQLCDHLDDAYEALCRLVERFHPEALITVAYEGAHPDHDSCSVLVAALARRYVLPAWEAPLYRRDADGQMVFQEFADPAGITTIMPTGAELERKRRAIERYASQGEICSLFHPEKESLRPLAAYDYTQLPNSGKLNYEAWGWPMRGAQLCEAFAKFLSRREVAR